MVYSQQRATAAAHAAAATCFATPGSLWAACAGGGVRTFFCSLWAQRSMNISLLFSVGRRKQRFGGAWHHSSIVVAAHVLFSVLLTVWRSQTGVESVILFILLMI